MKTACYYSLFFLLIVTLQSCSNSEKKEINTLLDTRIKSFEQKNIDLYSECIYKEYNENIDGEKIYKDGVIKNFKINISPFDEITFIKSEREIYINGNNAKVVIKTSVSLSIKDKKSIYNTTEKINLSKTNSQWKIVKESKLDLFRGYVFGER